MEGTNEEGTTSDETLDTDVSQIEETVDNGTDNDVSHETAVDEDVDTEDFEMPFVEDEQEADDSNDFDGVAEEDAAVISKVAKKELNPVVQKQAKLETELRVERFLNDRPEFRKYADRIRKVASSPVASKFRDIDSLVGAALGTKTMMQIGAEKARQSDDMSRRSRVGGTSHRPSSASTALEHRINEALQDPDKWEELNRRVMAGEFIE